jgi:hypothetical protein
MLPLYERTAGVPHGKVVLPEGMLVRFKIVATQSPLTDSAPT